LPERPAALNGIENLPQKFLVMDADVLAIKDFITKNT
jgi:threonine synthase